MRICAAQTCPIKGDISANIDGHIRLLGTAVDLHADAVIFPELSLTGYEPELARDLAADLVDSRLDVFQTISDRHAMIVCAGLPIRAETGLHIGMIQFHPNAPRKVYSKTYLHADEEPLFVPGPQQSDSASFGHNPKVALAICYELSVDLHADHASNLGADIYVASAVKTIEATAGAHTRMVDITRTYGMAALFSNSVGLSEGSRCGGKSSAWNRRGKLIGQLDHKNEGLVLFDTDTGECETVPA